MLHKKINLIKIFCTHGEVNSSWSKESLLECKLRPTMTNNFLGSLVILKYMVVVSKNVGEYLPGKNVEKEKRSVLSSIG